jgi:hypothetical protein
LDDDVLEPVSVLLLLLLDDGEDAWLLLVLVLVLWLPPPSRLLQNGGMLSHPEPKLMDLSYVSGSLSALVVSACWLVLCVGWRDTDAKHRSDVRRHLNN